MLDAVVVVLMLDAVVVVVVLTIPDGLNKEFDVLQIIPCSNAAFREVSGTRAKLGCRERVNRRACWIEARNSREVQTEEQTATVLLDLTN